MTGRGRHSRLILTLALCASVGVLVVSTQLLSLVETNMGGDSRRRRLQHHHASISQDLRGRSEQDVMSDTADERDGGPSEVDAWTLSSVHKEVTRDDGGEGSLKRQNLSQSRMVLKGYTAESIWKMDDFYYEREDTHGQDEIHTGRSLSQSYPAPKKKASSMMKTATTKKKTTTTATANGVSLKTMKQNQKKKMKMTKKMNGEVAKKKKKKTKKLMKKQSNGMLFKKKTVSPNTSGGGGLAPDVINMVGGQAPGYNKQKGQQSPVINNQQQSNNSVDNKKKGQQSPVMNYGQGGKNSFDKKQGGNRPGINKGGFDGSCSNDQDCLNAGECCSDYGFCGVGKEYCSIVKGTSSGGHAPGSNKKHMGNPPGINKQGGLSKTTRYNTSSPKVTNTSGATMVVGGKMCPCPTPKPQEWQGGYDRRKTIAIHHSIVVDDGSVDYNLAYPILNGGKIDKHLSEKIAARGHDRIEDGRRLTYVVMGGDSSGWWAPSEPAMCPCPTDPPTYHPTYHPTEIPTELPSSQTTGIPTDMPSETPSDVPTLLPTTVSPTKALEGCPWFFWGGKEGLGLAVGDVQETPELQFKEVIDLSAGSRHTFIIEEGGGVFVSGFIESLSAYRGHLGVMRDRIFEGPNGLLNVKAVVNSANKTVPSPVFSQVYAGAGAPGDSRGMHSLLIDRSGNVYTTGNNDRGQLCHGDLESRDMFRHVASLPGPAKAAAVGLDFTLILLSDGRIFGCGNNENGELGLGPNVTHSVTPDNRNGLSDIISVSAGLSFSLYLQADNVLGRVNKGQVYGSGSNLYSQLCNSTGGDIIAEPKVLNVGTVTSVHAGRESSYFLYENGSVQSCGRNDQGQLGDGTFKDSDKPVKVDLPANKTIRYVASGSSSASVFLSSGFNLVHGAGQNYQFQLGVGSIGSQNVPVLVEFDDSLQDIVKISSSGTHTIAISCPRETGMPTTSPTEFPTVEPTAIPTVLPTASPTNDPSISPTRMPTMSPIEEPTVSPTVITDYPTNEPTMSPTFITDNPTQEPTMSPTIMTDSPTQEPTMSPISITDNPTLEPTGYPTLQPTVTPTFITDNPTLLPTSSPTLIAVNWFYWGAEEGRGNTLGDNQQVPEEIQAKITDVSAGSRHIFLIDEDGTAVVAGFIESGAGYRGHLGLGPVTNKQLIEGNNVPLPIKQVVDAGGKVVDAPPFIHAYAGVGVTSDSGAMHAMMISEDGKAYLSGSNNKGQLCLGDLNQKYVDYFHEVKGIDSVVTGAVGEEFTLIVTESGQVFGCGSNEVGQLGEGPEVFESPTEIMGELNGITDVATGLGFAIYLNGDTGKIWGSGSNIYGQLCGFTFGNPVTVPEIVFKGVSEKVIQVEASRESSYFLFDTGKVRSCGRNDEGQLGNGNSINSSEDETEALVDLNEKIKRLGSGPSAQSIFFIGEDGVWASGLNDRFQLGTGEIGSATTPMPVKFDGPVDIEYISASGSHTVANGRYLT